MQQVRVGRHGQHLAEVERGFKGICKDALEFEEVDLEREMAFVLKVLEEFDPESEGEPKDCQDKLDEQIDIQAKQQVIAQLKLFVENNCSTGSCSEIEGAGVQ